MYPVSGHNYKNVQLFNLYSRYPCNGLIWSKQSNPEFKLVTEFFATFRIAKNSIMIRARREAKKEELAILYGLPKQEIYQRLIKEGLDLPPINSPAVDRDYLKGVDEGYHFRFYKKDVKSVTGPIKCSRLVIYVLLKEIVPVELGFRPNRLPSKQWLLKALSIVNPNHAIFLPARDREELIGLMGHDVDIEEEFRKRYHPLGQRQDNEIQRTQPLIKDELLIDIELRMKAFKTNYPFVIIKFP